MFEFLWENPVGDIFFDGVNYVSNGIHGLTGFRCAFTPDATAARRTSAAQIARGGNVAPQRISIPARGSVAPQTRGRVAQPTRGRVAPPTRGRVAPPTRGRVAPPTKTGIAGTIKARG